MKPSIPEYYKDMTHGPDELHNATLDSLFVHKVEKYDDRLAIVSLAMARHLVDVLNIDRDTANEVVARSLRGFLAATAITLSDNQLKGVDDASKEAQRILREQSLEVDTAILEL